VQQSINIATLIEKEVTQSLEKILEIIREDRRIYDVVNLAANVARAQKVSRECFD
jgi:hypothetical protein